MNKTDVAKSIEEYTGRSFISKQEVADFLGYTNIRSVDRIVYGLDKVGNKYFSKDVAEAIVMKGKR